MPRVWALMSALALDQLPAGQPERRPPDRYPWRCSVGFHRLPIRSQRPGLRPGPAELTRASWTPSRMAASDRKRALERPLAVSFLCWLVEKCFVACRRSEARTIVVRRIIARKCTDSA